MWKRVVHDRGLSASIASISSDRLFNEICDRFDGVSLSVFRTAAAPLVLFFLALIIHDLVGSLSALIRQWETNTKFSVFFSTFGSVRRNPTFALIWIDYFKLFRGIFFCFCFNLILFNSFGAEEWRRLGLLRCFANETLKKRVATRKTLLVCNCSCRSDGEIYEP